VTPEGSTITTLTPLCWMQYFSKSAHSASKYHPSKTTCHYPGHSHIQSHLMSFIIYELLLHRHIFHYDGIKHIIEHWWDDDNATVQVDKDRRTYEWAPARWRKSFSSLTHSVYIRRGEGVVMTKFRQYKSHPFAFHPPTHSTFYMKTWWLLHTT
jgi:hypothetical protein